MPLQMQAHRDKFLETFVVTNFQVMGNTNDALKTAMALTLQIIELW